jgi:predicted RND superfamily exporter protein
MLLVATLPWVVPGSQAVDCDTSGLTQWLPDRQPERNRYSLFLEHFGADDSVLVSWPGCTLEDPRLERLASLLLRQAGPETNPAEDRLIEEIITGQRLLDRLTSGPIELARREALQRLTGFVVGPDGQTTCAIIKLTSRGLGSQKRVIQTIERVAADECGLAAEELRLGGAAYDAFVMDIESDRSVRGYTIQAAVITIIVAWFCLRSLRMIVAIGLAAAYCRLLTMAIVYYTGAHLSAVLIVAPALVYVLTVSGSVHLANYYQDAAQEHGWRGSGWRAFGLGWQPCLLAAVSTSIGLASLGVSQIAPIREFGYYSAGCLMLALGVMLLFVPSALELWPLGKARIADDAEREPTISLARKCLTQRLPDFVIRYHRGLMLATIFVMLVVGYGLRHTKTTVKIEGMFRSDTALVRNYRWIEEQIGPLGTIEVIVGFDEACPLDVLERARLVGRMDRSIRQIPEVTNTVSAATFLPPFSDRGGTRGVIRRTIYRKRLENNLPALVQDRLVAQTAEAELWRITARVPTLHTSDYASLAREAVKAIDETTAETQEELAHVSVSHTGLLPMIETAQHLLLSDLVKSFVLAVALICPVMMLVLHDVRAGALSMIPNVTPVVIVFGAMGWCGLEIDVGSVLTASVALGIAVDDTLHFLKWYARASQLGFSRHEAIREAFRRCAPAMVQTTLICGLGLLVLVQSTFIPTCRFAVLVFLLLALALPGDLILLPAILASPLGKYFERRRNLPPRES